MIRHHSLVRTAEAEVDRLASQVDVELTRSAARALVRDRAYEESYGLLLGRHYRKRRGEGCYHLRVRGDRAWLHWDGQDPRRFPVGHFFETPVLWVPSAVAIAVAAVVVIQKE